MTRSYRLVFGLALMAMLGCAPSGPQAERDGGGATAHSETPKTLTIGQLNALRAFSSEDFSNTSGGGASLAEIHMNGLVTNDAHGNLEPRLAARIPSLDDGSVSVLPDGRMVTVWNLRPGARWHDGVPFTADDIVFSWQVAAHPDIPMAGSAEVVNALTERVEALDPLTFRVTWKTTYFRALWLGHRDLWPLPRHVLEASLGQRDAFLNHPYWTTDYVHTGPFRLLDFGLGETVVFQRFDDYFLGRPPLDRIVIRVIADPNTLLANFKAGSIDLLAEKTLPLDIAPQLRDEWQQTGAATMVSRQENWRYLWFQFDSRWAHPPELSRDVRIRRALLFGFDRDALREFLFPGFPGTSGDTFMPQNDPRDRIVGRPFARYPYDVARATQELADGGWRRAPDGRVLNATGEPVQIEVRGTPTDAKEVALVAENWRRLGLDIKEEIQPLSVQRDNEAKAKFPGLETRARASGDQIFPSFDGRLHSLAENRWTGANSGHYANPALDRLIDQLYGSIDEREQGLILREMGELLATDLPALPMYYRTVFAVVARGVRALTDDYVGTRGPGEGPGVLSRNAHLWGRD